MADPVPVEPNLPAGAAGGDVPAAPMGDGASAPVASSADIVDAALAAIAKARAQGTADSDAIAKALAEAQAALGTLQGIRTTAGSEAQEALTALQAVKTTAGSEAQSISSYRATAEKDAPAASAAKDEAQAQAQAATSASTSAKGAADAATASSTAAKSAADAANADGTRAGSAATEAQALKQKIADVLVAAERDRTALTQALANAQQDQGSTKGLAEQAVRVEAELAGYKTGLQSLTTGFTAELAKAQEQFGALYAKIDALLPGATSAGLAKTFRDRQAGYAKAQTRYGYLFLGTMTLFSVATIVAVYLMVGSAPAATWDVVVIGLCLRLPLAVPFVWVGWLASKHYWIARRLEDDYAYKASLADSFEGFKREMATTQADSQGELPVNRLMRALLDALAFAPEGIHRSKRKDDSVLREFLDSKDVKEILDAIRKWSPKIVPSDE